MHVYDDPLYGGVYAGGSGGGSGKRCGRRRIYVSALSVACFVDNDGGLVLFGNKSFLHGRFQPGARKLFCHKDSADIFRQGLLRKTHRRRRGNAGFYGACVRRDGSYIQGFGMGFHLHGDPDVGVRIYDKRLCAAQRSQGTEA